MAKMGFYIIITSQKESLFFFRKLMTMLVFHEDLNEKCQVLKKWQHFFIFFYVFFHFVGIMLIYVKKILITSLPDKV